MNRGKYFNYQRGELFCESTPISEVVQKIGTPLYLYSYHSLINNYREVRDAFQRLSPLICYALKANGILLSRSS